MSNSALPAAVFAALALAGAASAQSPRPALARPPALRLDWERVYEHGITGHDSFAALDLAPDGSVIAAGSSLGFNGSYTYEIVTLKYGADGALLWERRYDSAGAGFDDVAVDVAISPNGDVIVLGQGPGSSGNQDVITLCYDPFGALRWAARFDNNWSDGATALAVAKDGSIYVLGGTYFAGSVSDVALLKYDAQGGLLWSRFFHGGWGTDVGVGLALDPAGDVLVGGYAIAAPGGTNFDWLALKYDSSGNLAWSATRSGAAAGWPDYCWSMNADAAGNLLLTGFLVNTQSLQDFTTMKFSNSGQFLWSRTLGTATGSGQSVAADAAGNVHVAGGSQLLSYSASGALRWQKTFTAPGLGAGSVSAIALDAAGRLYATGTVYDPLARGTCLTVVHQPLGGLADWVISAGGPAPHALALGAGGRIGIAGADYNGHDNDGLVAQLSLIP